MGRKRRRPPVPEVLRRVYGGCVKTLENIILSLLPDPPPDSPLECSCNGRLCLGCLGRSYLIREEDPADYLLFTTHSFCFLHPRRPPPPGDFSFTQFCLSHELTTRRMITVLRKRMNFATLKMNTTLNKLYRSYAAFGPFAGTNGKEVIIVDSDGKADGFFSACALKCSHAWDLLLERVGGHLMVYLLQNSSIFIPLTNNNYLQITGEPLKVRKFQVLPLKRQLQSQSTKKQSNVQSIMQLRYHKRRPLFYCILKQVYGCRVRTLVSTILSLLPKSPWSSPLDCFCQGQLCLGCLGVSYLIQSGDPEDYRKLLLNTYCFLPFDAPEPPSNFLASGLSLDVIGDELMVFLLKYSAIFIARTNKCCQQVTGNPLDNLFVDDVKHSDPNVRKFGNFNSSHLKKDPAVHGSRKRRREFSWQRRGKQRKLVEAANRSGNDSCGEHKLQDPTLINFSGTDNMNEKFSRHGGIPQGRSKKSALECFCCILFGSPSKMVIGDHVKRKIMFYSRFSSKSLLPSQNILNRLRPTNSGVLHLLHNIFIISGNEVRSEVLHSRLDPNTVKRLCPCLKISDTKCLFRSLLILLKALIRNSQRCQYKELLWRHCLNPIFRKDNTIHDDPELEPSVNSYSSHHQVASFVWAATRSVVPKEFLGDSVTWRALRKNISKFVKLRRFENFSLRQCIQGLKPSHYPFLLKFTCFHCSSCEHRNQAENQKKKKKCGIPCDMRFSLQNQLFCSWIYWYFSYFVVPMIHNNFYVTERQSGRHDMFYYPKPIWKKLLEQSVAQLKAKNYCVLDQTSLEKLLKERKIRLRGKAFGFSRVRFLPKEKNMRPLVNLKAPSKFLLSCNTKGTIHPKAVERQSKPVWYKAVNSTLGELRAILRRIKAEDPIKLGASVFDYNDIYCRFHQFIPLVRKRTAVFPNLYIVVADVCKAFDTIDQDMLISIMNDVIQLDTYFLSSKFICTKKSIMAVHERLCFDQFNGNKSSVDSDANLQLNSSHCVLIEKGTCADVQKHTLICILMEHLKHNILQIERDFYLQKVGIPQGSILSSILCCFYYGHLERHVILPFLEKAFEISSKARLFDPFMQPNEELGGEPHERLCNGHSDVESVVSAKPKMLNSPGDDLKCLEESLLYKGVCMEESYTSEVKCSSKPHNLLLRLIDDFLFISTSKAVAESFFARMRRGFRAYNCYMNLDKFGLNFDVENPPPSQRLFTGADGLRFIPWSGLLINCETLEIQADYTRYWGAHMSSSITFKAGAKPGRTLKKKLCDYMRPKCHPLFYDSNINSQATVSLNAYQVFLLSAMKFHCYLRAMESTSRQSWSYILDKILLSLRYMYRLIKKRMHELGARLSMKPVLKLNNAEIVWLGLSAYIRVLKKKQSRYGELIYLLKGKLAKHTVDDTSPHLRYAVDDYHSSMFWKIKF